MKGKIAYSEVNTAIDHLAKAAKEKYKIVNKSKPSSQYERQMKIAYKDQEDKSTQGIVYM